MTFYSRHLIVEEIVTYHMVSSVQDKFGNQSPHLKILRSQRSTTAIHRTSSHSLLSGGRLSTRALLLPALKLTAECIRQQKFMALWFSSSMKQALSNETGFMGYPVQCMQCFESCCRSLREGHTQHQNLGIKWFSYSLKVTLREYTTHYWYLVQSIQAYHFALINDWTNSLTIFLTRKTSSFLVPWLIMKLFTFTRSVKLNVSVS